MNVHSRTRVIAALLIWGIGLTAVVASVWRYEAASVTTIDAPVEWPADGAIARPPGKTVMVMFLHPHCPCSMASIEELALGLGRSSIGVVHVAMLRPTGAADGWERGELWNTATRISGVTVHVDRDGALARRFKAAASGHVMLYDEAGSLRFSGGLTPSRGTTGGGDVLYAVARGEWSSRPVFGCPLFDDELCEATGQCPTIR